MFSLRSQAPLFLLLAVGLGGCSGKLADVKGTVTAEGVAVTGGGVVLSPIGEEDNLFPGKPGMADIRPDGTFALTLEPGAKGLAQRFNVRFTPPPAYHKLTEEELKVTPPEDVPYFTDYVGLIPKEAVVEIKPGKNVVDIELIPRPPK